MLAVDTNVVIRFLVDDDAAQHKRAVALFRKHSIWLSRTVLMESEWVLRSVYDFEASEIAQAFICLIGLPNVICDAPPALTESIKAMEQGMDFADALHLQCATNAACDEGFATFDGRFIKRAGKQWPETKLRLP